MELKLRAWLKELEEMVEHDQIIAPFIFEPSDSVGGTLKFEKLFRYYTSLTHSSWEDELFKDVILLLYSGVNDKTGREIYAGHIVYRESTGTIGEVKFDKGKFYVRWKGLAGYSMIDSDVDTCYNDEIKGSVYENPEMLFDKSELVSNKNYYSCMDCEWEGKVNECDFDTEYDEFKGIDRKYPICPKCGGGLDC